MKAHPAPPQELVGGEVKRAKVAMPVGAVPDAPFGPGGDAKVGNIVQDRKALEELVLFRHLHTQSAPTAGRFLCL